MKRDRDKDLEILKEYVIKNGYITVRRAALILKSSFSYARSLMQLLWEEAPDMFSYESGVLVYNEVG